MRLPKLQMQRIKRLPFGGKRHKRIPSSVPLFGDATGGQSPEGGSSEPHSRDLFSVSCLCRCALPKYTREAPRPMRSYQKYLLSAIRQLSVRRGEAAQSAHFSPTERTHTPRSRGRCAHKSLTPARHGSTRTASVFQRPHHGAAHQERTFLQPFNSPLNSFLFSWGGKGIEVAVQN